MGLLLVVTPLLAEFDPAIEFAVGNQPVDLLVADFDSDGRLDLLTVDRNGNQLSFLYGAAAGNFDNAVTVATDNKPIAATTADFDNDGLLDIAVVHWVGNDISVFHNDGNRQFSLLGQFDVGKHPVWVGSADLNGDGRGDLVTVHKTHGEVGILLADDLGGFMPVSHHNAGSKSTHASLGDVNHDGHVDVLVSNSTGNDLSLLLNFGDGNLAAETRVSLNGAPGALYLDDLNDDGNADIVVSLESGFAAVLDGNGDGSFATPVDYPSVASPFAAARGDFNGDCVLDLAVAGSTDLAILSGNAGGFGAPQMTAGLGSLSQMIVADLNGDLRLDVAVSDPGANLVRIFHGADTNSCSGFVLRKATTPAAVKTSVLNSTMQEAPLNVVGWANDGIDAYFLIAHSGGVDLDLTVFADRANDLLRFGFDDGLVDNAVADLFATQLNVLQADAPADGITPTLVQVTPVDLRGLPLGTGLTLTALAADLLPATVDGEVRDLGNGHYEVRVICNQAGPVTLKLEVEGAELASVATLNFFAP